MNGGRSSTAAEALVTACERLIAERGFHGVTASEVVRAAGQRNNSAIVYHFGSWEGLLDAVWARHTAAINEHRVALLAHTRNSRRADLPALVSAYVVPLVADIKQHQPSYWARFNEQWLAVAPLNVFSRPAGAPGSDHNPRADEVSVLADTFRRTINLLRHLSPKDRSRRVALMARFVISALAAWERDQAEEQPAISLEHLSSELVGLAVALLEAPDSATTRRPAQARGDASR
jgi:AcrR family transcriptional regulator